MRPSDEVQAQQQTLDVLLGVAEMDTEHGLTPAAVAQVRVYDHGGSMSLVRQASDVGSIAYAREKPTRRLYALV